MGRGLANSSSTSMRAGMSAWLDNTLQGHMQLDSSRKHAPACAGRRRRARAGPPSAARRRAGGPTARAGRQAGARQAAAARSLPPRWRVIAPAAPARTPPGAPAARQWRAAPVKVVRIFTDFGRKAGAACLADYSAALRLGLPKAFFWQLHMRLVITLLYRGSRSKHAVWEAATGRASEPHLGPQRERVGQARRGDAQARHQELARARVGGPLRRVPRQQLVHGAAALKVVWQVQRRVHGPLMQIDGFQLRDHRRRHHGHLRGQVTSCHLQRELRETFRGGCSGCGMLDGRTIRAQARALWLRLRCLRLTSHFCSCQ